MSMAALTVSTSALSEKSAVLARPLRLPTYTVISSDLSCWNSICSISPSRTLTLCPMDSLKSASAAAAPMFFAKSKACPHKPVSSEAVWLNSIKGFLTEVCGILTVFRRPLSF